MAVAPSSAFTGTRHLLVSGWLLISTYFAACCCIFEYYSEFCKCFADNPFKQKPQLPATKVPPAKHLRHNNIRVEQSLSPGEPRKRFSVRTKVSHFHFYISPHGLFAFCFLNFFEKLAWPCSPEFYCRCFYPLMSSSWRPSLSTIRFEPLTTG
jgi:hypothetical protein